MASIVADHLTKRYGQVVAVSDVSFAVEQGTVTGFLGPNGAGKTTTLRMLLGLAKPDSGNATINGKQYREFAEPLREVGAALESASFYPGRTARNHIRLQAIAAGISTKRVDEVLGMMGLSDSADRRVSGFSLGMRQRLGLATAMLGDPKILILDEPANGLDPEGVRWLRDLLRGLAKEGRSILISSHILAEVAQTVDNVIILDRGRLIAQSSLEELTARAGAGSQIVKIRTSKPEELRKVLADDGAEARIVGTDRVEISGSTQERVGTLAAERGIPIFDSTAEGGNLEDVFFRLTAAAENDTAENAATENDGVSR
jgi:ABC-2 type transport system ATP-binding protein